jgi:hypothetical protein
VMLQHGPTTSRSHRRLASGPAWCSGWLGQRRDPGPRSNPRNDAGAGTKQPYRFVTISAEPVLDSSRAHEGVSTGAVPNDLKPRLAESFVEAGKDVAVIPFGPHFIFPALDQNVGLEQVIDASNYHGDIRRPSISSSSHLKTTSTGIKVSVTHHMIPSWEANRYGVMAQSP